MNAAHIPYCDPVSEMLRAQVNSERAQKRVAQDKANLQAVAAIAQRVEARTAQQQAGQVAAETAAAIRKVVPW